MGKTLVSMRLDDELLAWSASYAKERRSNRTVVVEEALRSLKADSEGGVPDLPVESPQMREARAKVEAPQRPIPGVTTAGALARRRANPNGMTRQDRVNRLGQGPKS